MAKHKAVAEPTLKDAASQAWHPCDDFILPLMRAIEDAQTNEPNEAKLLRLSTSAMSATSRFGVSWLELNVSLEYGREFEIRVCEDLPRRISHFDERFIDDEFYKELAMEKERVRLDLGLEPGDFP